MDNKWTIIGFHHRGDGIHYDWTHSTINITSELTPGQLEQVVTWAESHDVWFSGKRKKFLCRSATELSAVEDMLTAAGYSYDVETSDLTADDKAIIEKAQISNRNKIAELLESEKVREARELLSGFDFPAKAAADRMSPMPILQEQVAINTELLQKIAEYLDIG